MRWLHLAIAILAEAAATNCLRASAGFGSTPCCLPSFMLGHPPDGLCVKLVEPVGIEPTTSSLQS